MSDKPEFEVAEELKSTSNPENAFNKASVVIEEDKNDENNKASEEDKNDGTNKASEVIEDVRKDEKSIGGTEKSEKAEASMKAA